MATCGVNLGCTYWMVLEDTTAYKPFPNPVQTLSKPSTRVFKPFSEGKGWILRDLKGLFDQEGKDLQVKIANRKRNL